MKCDEHLLPVLLRGDEESDEYRSASHHVDSCTQCQQRLTELSVDPSLLTEIQETLRADGATDEYVCNSISSVVLSIEQSADDDVGATCEPITLDFLEPASHPEMLGRLGRYEIERTIGSGGMGIVFKAFDTELHRVVAIKVLKPHLAHNGAARRRFAREAQSAAAVVHEHVVPIHDVWTDGDTPYLVMQYVPGQSLQARVDQRGPLDAREVLRITHQAAAGLAAAHAQGVVHRDVKPANILLEESIDRVLISDFGLARTIDDATVTGTGVVAGTPHYMSPEQASGYPVDHRSDLFSLGSAMYFMCSGRPPFRAEHALAILNRICTTEHRPVEEVNPDIPAELADVIDRLLSKQPASRFHDAKAVERHVASLLASLQNGRRSRRLWLKRAWRRRRYQIRLSLAAGSVVAMCLFAGAGLAVWNQDSSSVNQIEQSAVTPALLQDSARATTDNSGHSKTENPNAARTPRLIIVPPDTFGPELTAVNEILDSIEGNERKVDSSAPTQNTDANEWTKSLRETERMLGALHGGQN